MVAATTNTARTADRRTVVGVFDGPHHAEQALNGLRDAGFTPEQVSVVAQDRADMRQMAERTEMTGEGAASGAVTGGVLGGIAGFLVGISALVIPGIGPIVGAGIIASTLVGAGVGAAAGGLVGALTEQGVPEEDARGYEAHVKEGRILLTVHAATDEQAREAHAIFGRHGGGDVRAYGVSGAAMGRSADSDSLADEAGAGVGGAGGAVAGGVIGTAVAGPVGTVAGAAIGGAAGAGVGHAAGEASESDSTTSGLGAATGGAAGAVTGGAIGALGGPVGAAAGAAIGGAVGASGSAKAEDAVADSTDPERDTPLDGTRTRA